MLRRWWSKKRRRFLRRSESADVAKRIDDDDARPGSSTTTTGGGHSEPNGRPIRSATLSRLSHHNNGYGLNDSRWELSSGGGGTCSSDGDRKGDSKLDAHMMQMITDVKYVKRRPKFVAVGEVNFQRACVEAHNALRLKHGAAPLLWSQELADLAAAWASKLADRGTILYPDLPGLGENIRIAEASESEHLPTGDEVVEFWQKESTHVNFAAPKWSAKALHFTQMVWKDTVEMGIARHWNTAQEKVAVVAFYRPAGNLNAPGEFAANIQSADELLCASSQVPAQQHSQIDELLTSPMKRSVRISSPKL